MRGQVLSRAGERRFSDRFVDLLVTVKNTATGAICASKTPKHLKSLRSQRRGNISASKSGNRRGHVICGRAALSANADD